MPIRPVYEELVYGSSGFVKRRLSAYCAMRASRSVRARRFPANDIRAGCSISTDLQDQRDMHPLRRRGPGGGTTWVFLLNRQRNVLVTIHTPTTIMHKPMARLTQCPAGTIFSTRTYAAIVATQSRFITPATNNRAISSQQQPTQ